jgi:hypothetical protein
VANFIESRLKRLIRRWRVQALKIAHEKHLSRPYLRRVVIHRSLHGVVPATIDISDGEHDAFSDRAASDTRECAGSKSLAFDCSQRITNGDAIG